MNSNQIKLISLNKREIIIPTTCSMIIGFTSGSITSSKLSGYQFIVENLHRLPKNRNNWYFFQKTKNYKIILGGIRGGLKTGIKLTSWTFTFCTLKEGFTQLPFLESRKSISGGISGLGVALGASIFYQIRPILAPRRLLLATALGLCAGMAEDAKIQLT